MIEPIGNLRHFWSKVGVKFEINETYEPCGSQFCEGCQTGGHCWRRYPCWEWRTGKSGKYAHFRTPSGQIGAHRIAFFLGKGIDPEGSFICHHCDNRRCQNPAHLFLGNPADNGRDMSVKGRSGAQVHPETLARGDRNGSRLHPETRPRGDQHGSRLHPENRARGVKHGSQTHPERLARGDQNGARLHPEALARGDRHGSSKLKAWQIPYIRTLLENGISHAVIAKAYNVDTSTIWHIARGKTWTHV